MADIEATTDAPAQAAAAAAQATVAVIENVEATAERLVENAELRVEAAQAVAQQITDAALQTEIGRQVSTIREDVTAWRAEQENQATRLMSLEQSLTEAQTRLTELNSVLANLSPLTQPPPLIIPATPEAAEILPGPEAPLISPLQAVSEGNTESAAETPLEIRRKKRFV